MGLSKVRCEDGRWICVAQDRVQLLALILAEMNLRFLLPERLLCKMYHAVFWKNTALYIRYNFCSGFSWMWNLFCEKILHGT